MITQIDVMSENQIVLPIMGITPKSSLLIRKITGLGPPDRTLFIGDYSSDGGIYQGRRVGSRNVVFTFDLNPNPALGETIPKLRQKLYKAFLDPQANADYLKMVLHDEDEGDLYLVGYCEKFETEVFDSDTLCQISMICPDPYIRADEDTVLANPTGWVQLPFNYNGGAETGFEIRINVISPTNSISLQNVNFSSPNTSQELSLVSPTGYDVGDIIIINTTRGRRAITLTKAVDFTGTPTEFEPPSGYAYDDVVFYNSNLWRVASFELGGSTSWRNAPSENSEDWEKLSTSIVSNMLPSSQWIELYGQNNLMMVYEGYDVSSIVANFNYLKYTAAYWGV